MSSLFAEWLLIQHVYKLLEKPAATVESLKPLPPPPSSMYYVPPAPVPTFMGCAPMASTFGNMSGGKLEYLVDPTSWGMPPENPGKSSVSRPIWLKLTCVLPVAGSEMLMVYYMMFVCVVVGFICYLWGISKASELELTIEDLTRRLDISNALKITIDDLTRRLDISNALVIQTQAQLSGLQTQRREELNTIAAKSQRFNQSIKDSDSKIRGLASSIGQLKPLIDEYGVRVNGLEDVHDKKLQQHHDEAVSTEDTINLLNERIQHLTDLVQEQKVCLLHLPTIRQRCD